MCGLLACAVPVSLWLAAIIPLVTNEGFGGGGELYALAALLAVGAAGLPVWRKANCRAALQSITGATVCVFALDAVLGGPLFARSPLSYSPLEGARFYGAGNESAGVFLGASLAFALLCGTKTGFWARLLLGLGAVVLLGGPTLGANVGGTLAALAGWATLLVGGIPAPRRKQAAFLAGASVTVLLAAFLLWESRRPPTAQTHLGRALANAQTPQRGANGGLIPIARRKIAMNAHLAVSSPWSLLLLVEIGLCTVLLRRGAAKRGEVIALFVGAGAAFVANDSGVVMAAACLLFAPPLLFPALTKPRPSAPP